MIKNKKVIPAPTPKKTVEVEETVVSSVPLVEAAEAAEVVEPAKAEPKIPEGHQILVETTGDFQIYIGELLIHHSRPALIKSSWEVDFRIKAKQLRVLAKDISDDISNEVFQAHYEVVAPDWQKALYCCGADQ